MEIIIAYCQDNEISWLDWKRLETNQELYRFFRKMIWFRREHPAIRSDQEPSETGFPAVSIHTDRAWDCSIDRETKALAVCYAGKTDQGEDLVYMALNVYWEEQSFELPKLPEGYEWRLFYRYGPGWNRRREWRSSYHRVPASPQVCSGICGYPAEPLIL